MDSPRETNRRDFLAGRAAARAIEDLADRGEAPEPESPLAAEQRPASFLLEITRRAMATDFQVFLNSGQYTQAADAALEALDLVEQLEDQITVYREESELQDINRRAASRPVIVESRLFGILQLCLDLFEATDGAFDVTSGPLSKVWGFYRRQGMFPEEVAVQQALSRLGSREIELDPQEQTIYFRKPDLDINLNAIGKGYALDRCGEVLQEAGVDDFLIHGGQSSILAAGSRQHADGWQIAVRHPLRPQQRLAELCLQDAAIGTSGSGTQFFHHKGRRYGHVLDPRTGWPAEGVLSATVIAPTAALADALSTAFYVMGLERATAYCEDHPELSAMFVCPGKRHGSISLHPVGLDDSDWSPWKD